MSRGANVHVKGSKTFANSVASRVVVVAVAAKFRFGRFLRLR